MILDGSKPRILPQDPFDQLTNHFNIRNDGKVFMSFDKGRFD